jgi:hypothetical protein
VVTIALRSGGGALEHLHVKEDLSSQVDGYSTVFDTTFAYKPGTLIVFLDGVAMRTGADNDFVESGAQQFTWVNDAIGPPGSGAGACATSMFAYYERVLP